MSSSCADRTEAACHWKSVNANEFSSWINQRFYRLFILSADEEDHSKLHQAGIKTLKDGDHFNSIVNCKLKAMTQSLFSQLDKRRRGEARL